MYLPTFLICKDTQHRRASSVNNFRFSPCYSWEKAQIPGLVCSLSSCPHPLSSHSCTPCQLASFLILKHTKHIRALALSVLPGKFSLQTCVAHSTLIRSLFQCHLIQEALSIPRASHFYVHCWLLYFYLQPSLLTESPDIFTPLFPGHWAALLSPHT